MTQSNLKWVLVTAPGSHGNASISIATVDDAQVKFSIRGEYAAEIAHMLIEAMHPEEEEQKVTVH